MPNGDGERVVFPQLKACGTGGHVARQMALAMPRDRFLLIHEPN